MKRGKDDGKIMGPMFPRLHVNNTEKGGPKAPPRNKMALYEQLSIPAQRFNHSFLPLNSNDQAANLENPSNQGIANERGIFFSCQLPTRHLSEKLYSQYSDFSIPFAQVKQRKKMDEDDFKVPIFVQSFQSQECGKIASGLDREKISPSNTSNFNGPLKFHNFKKLGMLESDIRQEDKSQKEENSKEFVTDRVKAVSSSTTEKAEGLKRHPDSSVCHEPRNNPSNNIDRLKTCHSIEPELCSDFQHVSGDIIVALDKIDSRAQVKKVRESQSHDLRNDEASHDKSSMTVPMRNFERVDSVSENSVVDSISRLDINPDDMVGIIGQKHFWKARKAILNQQRVFSIQVFELHRLVKVQRSIAASPQLLVDDSSYLGKPMNVLPRAKVPLNRPLKANPNVSKQKGESDKANQKESPAEDIVEKPSFSPIQNGVLPSTCRPLTDNSQSPSVNSSQNAPPWCFHQSEGHQWLIPVMSPSEGLVYKPYPMPGFIGPSCTGCGPPGLNPVIGGFLFPPYGIPAPHPHEYQLPSFPPADPHGYFPTYRMPIMHTAAFSGSSVDQMSPTPIPSQTGDANVGIQQPNLSTTQRHKNQASPDAFNSLHPSKDVEVQTSTASSPAVRPQDSRGSNNTGQTNVFQLFPTSPAVDPPSSSPHRPKPERTRQVIKVVPHNARSAAESATRIFRSIQEERKQYDSV